MHKSLINANLAIARFYVYELLHRSSGLWTDEVKLLKPDHCVIIRILSDFVSDVSEPWPIYSLFPIQLVFIFSSFIGKEWLAPLR